MKFRENAKSEYNIVTEKNLSERFSRPNRGQVAGLARAEARIDVKFGRITWHNLLGQYRWLVIHLKRPLILKSAWSGHESMNGPILKESLPGFCPAIVSQN